MTAVVFDIGGVLLDWNPRYLFRKLCKHEAAIDRFMTDIDFNSFNLQRDAGRSWPDGIAELSVRFPEYRALIEAMDDRWIEMIRGPIEGSVALLKELSTQGVPLYAITNFSKEKWTLSRAHFDFLSLFKDCVVSGEEGVLKPDPEIFRIFLKRNALQAADCLFIDDSQKNVDGAIACGLKAVRFENPDRLRHYLRASGFSV